MKKITGLLLLILLLTGCRSVPKLSSEDLDVLTKYAPEIAMLHRRDVPPNSRQKYEAAKKLADGVDFSFTTNVQLLDTIFSVVDARVDNPKSYEQQLMFLYQWQGKSVRFLFTRFGNYVTRAEVLEK